MLYTSVLASLSSANRLSAFYKCQDPATFRSQKCRKNHVTTALTTHLRTQIREAALVHLNTYLATAHVQQPAFVPAFQIIIFFLWHFDPIPGHGLPLRSFAITLTGHTTLGRTPLD